MISTENKLKVVEFLDKKEKINAIKFVMDTYKVRLKEAHSMVESVEIEFYPDRKKSSVNTTAIIGWTFTFVGLTCLVFSIVMFLNDRKASKNSLTVTGTVNDFNYSGGSASPVIRYTLNGVEKTIQGSTWSKPPAYDIGEKVELLIANDGSGKVIINNFSERYFLLTFLGGFAIVFGLIGSLVVIFLRN